MKQIPYSDLEWFMPNLATNSSRLRIKLLKKGLLSPKCYECELVEWRGMPAPLHLDHIDGNRANCMLSNLRLLCPNCHALTDTYAGRNIGRIHAERITKEALEREYDLFVAEHGNLPSANRLYHMLGRLGGVGSRENSRRVQAILGDERPLSSRSYTRNGRSRQGHSKGGRAKIEWPSDSDMVELLSMRSRVEVSEMLGVSDNAVKKRCLTRGIKEPDYRRMRPRKPKPN